MNDDLRHEAHMEDRLYELDHPFVREFRALMEYAECAVNGHENVTITFCKKCGTPHGFEEPA